MHSCISHKKLYGSLALVLPKHKPGSPWENCSLPTTSQLHLVCTTWSLLRTVLDPASWWLSQSCDSYRAAFALEMWAQMGQITNTTWKNTCGTLPVQLQQWHPCGGNSGMAPKPSKSLHRTRQICHWPWNVKSTIVATCNFAASPCLHYTISTQDHLRPCLLAAAFAV